MCIRDRPRPETSSRLNKLLSPIVLVLGVGRCAFRPPRVVFVLGLVSLINSLTSGKKIDLRKKAQKQGVCTGLHECPVGCAASKSKRKWSLPFRLGPTPLAHAQLFGASSGPLCRHRHAAVLRILLARRGRLGAACAAVATVSALAAPAAVCAIEQVLLYCRAVPSAASDDRHHCSAC